MTVHFIYILGDFRSDTKWSRLYTREVYVGWHNSSWTSDVFHCVLIQGQNPVEISGHRVFRKQVRRFTLQKVLGLYLLDWLYPIFECDIDDYPR